MLGDAEWAEGLEHGWAQHVADCARFERECMTFEEWAVERAWIDFTAAARYARRLPPIAWKAGNPIEATITPSPGSRADGASRIQYGSRMLMRRALSGLILVNQLLLDMKAADVVMWRAVVTYLDAARRKRRRQPLGGARRWVFDWLMRAAQRDRAVTHELLTRVHSAPKPY